MYVGACYVHVYMCLQHTNSVPLTSLYCPHLTHLVRLGRGKNISDPLPLGCAKNGVHKVGFSLLV